MKQSALNQGRGADGNSSQLQMLANEEGKLTLQGEVKIIDNSYFLQLNDGTQVELKTIQLSLGSYLGKRVELSGKIDNNKVEISKIQEL